MTGSKSQSECCMCGDFGFSFELFHCKICQFRSQHRYCSNLYPKADCYRICNWCLTLNQESNPKSPNSSSSIINNNDQFPNFRSQLNKPIKKQSSSSLVILPPPPPPPPPRRRLISVDEKLRRTRSEEISHRTGIKRPVIFRNKVRRYKLLDEVSS
ncbi:uncharacterized protein LOC101216451 [Cucumis sativus]|uniref:PHD-type zinc finger plants domain-containing protein n=1 Tax=Cucumis sativus TaxID=3659 RepID=A0A0A0LLR8_CUCSA|nr:uncharacterized protein LOC101216451 [Cucumis sativus]KGN62733.1 hypothetical protein Csa_022062 [Cucumis sativus]